MTMFLWRFSNHLPHSKKNSREHIRVFLFVYLLYYESQQLVLASGVVFRSESQRLVAYDAGGRVGVLRITPLGVGT